MCVCVCVGGGGFHDKTKLKSVIQLDRVNVSLCL